MPNEKLLKHYRKENDSSKAPRIFKRFYPIQCHSQTEVYACIIWNQPLILLPDNQALDFEAKY